MSQVIIEKVSKGKSDTKGGTIVFRLKEMKTEKTYDHLKHIWNEQNAFGTMVFVPNEYQYVENGEILYKRFVKQIKKNSITGYEEPIPDTIIFDERAGGLIVCDLSTSRGLSLYNFLKTHPNNGSNPNRDTNERIIFYQVDNAKEAEDEINKTIGYKEAMVKAFELTLDELRLFARLTGNNVRGKSEAELRVIASQYAMKDPTEFFSILKDRDGLIKAHIGEAEDKGVIVFSPSDRNWNWDSGVLIKQLPQNKDKEEGLYEYFSTKAGALAYAKMLELMDNTKSK